MRIYLRLAEIARTKRGWTLRRLADELEMDYQNVVNWNTGRSIPHLSTLIAIARLLRCSIDELIMQTEKPKETMDNRQEFYTGLKPLPSKRGRPAKKPGNRNPVKYSQNS